MKNKKIIITLICVGVIIGIIACIIVYKKDQILNNAEIQENENNGEQIGTQVMHISMLENDSIKNFEDPLFRNILIDGEKFQIGKKYEERLCVNNTGRMNCFVRAVITKKWIDSEGNETSILDKDLIELGFASEEDGWIYTEDEKTDRIILYYKNLIKPGESTTNFIEYLRINPSVQTETNIVEKNVGNGYKTINVTKNFYGYQFSLDVEVNAVQTHNAHDAILHTWFIDATISEDGNSIISINN